MQGGNELEELRVDLESIRALLDNLVVRGLRACGRDELLQIGSFAEHFDRSGAGHLAANLTTLKERIESDDRSSAIALLEAQTNVRLLERLLTLRVVKNRYAAAVGLLEQFELSSGLDGDFDDSRDAGEDEE